MESRSSKTLMRRIAGTVVVLFGMLSILGTGGGGGGGDDGTGGGGGGGGTGDSTVSELTILSASPTMSSDANTAAEGVEITAVALDQNRAVAAGQLVTLSVNSGALLNATSVTDQNGQVTAILTTGGNPQNRAIIVTASANSGALTDATTVQVVGTSMTLSGPTTLGFTDTGTYTVELTDAGGAGIPNQTVTLSSNTANAPNPTSVTTNSNGQATFQVTGNTGGVTTITATALGLTQTINITVSDESFTFQEPAAGAEIAINTPTTVRVRLLSGGNPMAGQTINFSSTRGDISGGDQSPTQDMTDAFGDAVVSIQSSAAGPALLTATGPGGLVASINIEFVATTPASVVLQVSPTNIPTNSESSITAIVRDANDNLVKNQIVNFSLQDVTGGTLSASTGTTNSQGIVKIQYRSSSQTSAANGVVITATLPGTPGPISDTESLTVGGNALRITIGTGNEILEPSVAEYALPYAMFVTDADGNPVSDAVVNLSVLTIAYQKGTRVPVDTNGDMVADAWGTDHKVQPGDPFFGFQFGCVSEDVNLNGFLDTGEDYNGNGSLEPTNDAFVPATVALNDNGTSFFDITYFKDRAYWVKIRLRVRVSVSGTESTEEAVIVLPGAADDFSDLSVAPPGEISPYGQGDPNMATTTCSNPD